MQILNQARRELDEYMFDRYRAYIHNFSKKQFLAERNRTAATDSQRQKVYSAECRWSYSLFESELPTVRRFKSFEETEKYFKKVAQSKTYQKLCEEFKGKPHPSLRLKRDIANSRSQGYARWDGVIALCPRNGLNEHVVLHELAHTCGNMHHDVGFRVAHVKLVSRFIGRKQGQLLHKAYRNQKLKMTVNRNKTPKSPSEWLKSYMLMNVARACK